MPKPPQKCTNQNVSDPILVAQISEIETMVQACKEKGGSLELRILYGCAGNDKPLGFSNRIAWPPNGYRDLKDENGNPRDYTENEKLYLAQILRQLMENAEKSTTKTCKNAETGFASQGFCKKANGELIKRPESEGKWPGYPGEVRPPFVPTKSSKTVQS